MVGSHSWRRRSIFRDRDLGSTFEQIFERYVGNSPDPEPDRDRLVGILVNADGTGAVDEGLEIKLRDVLERQRVLAPFLDIPSKENGVDIEGIASDGDSLYIGFRGPVLRDGFVPVLVLPGASESGAVVRFTRLHGGGIRDLARVENGFLVLSGAVGDARSPFRLYFWDGHDCLPGRRQAGDPALGRLALLGTIPAPDGASAEGLAVFDESGETYDIVVVFDGLDRGGATRFRVSKRIAPAGCSEGAPDPARTHPVPPA